MWGEGIVLFYFPVFARKDHVAQTGESFLGSYFLDLTVDFLVVDGAFHIADDSDSKRERIAVHHGKLLMKEVAGCMRVVYKHVINRVSVLAYLDCFQQEAVAHESTGIVFSEEHLFTVTEMDCALCAKLAVSDIIMYTVVENHADVYKRQGCSR